MYNLITLVSVNRQCNNSTYQVDWSSKFKKTLRKSEDGETDWPENSVPFTFTFCYWPPGTKAGTKIFLHSQLMLMFSQFMADKTIHIENADLSNNLIVSEISKLRRLGSQNPIANNSKTDSNEFGWRSYGNSDLKMKLYHQFLFLFIFYWIDQIQSFFNLFLIKFD